MKVKDREFKLPQWYFNYTYSNGWALAAALFVIFNGLIGLTGEDTLGPVGMAIVITIIWIIAAGGAAGPGGSIQG